MNASAASLRCFPARSGVRKTESPAGPRGWISGLSPIGKWSLRPLGEFRYALGFKLGRVLRTGLDHLGESSCQAYGHEVFPGRVDSFTKR